MIYDRRMGQVGIVLRARKWSTGWWVEKITKSPAHHVVIHIGSGSCISAEPGGVRIRSNDRYKHIVWTDFDLTDDQKHSMYWLAIGRQGIPYNYPAFLVLGLEFLTGLRAPQWVANRVNGLNRETCSQLAHDIYHAVGLNPALHAHIIAPAHWYRLAQHEGWTNTTK
ncbi:MAG: hypothetical protein L0G87_01360 [Renibacterium salmoninarum]|nr:hypothetical protein [Renibacterium salmoninarum]